jgi:hypothetical protein
MNEIQVSQDNNLSIAGLELTRNSLVIPKEATDSQVASVGHFLQSVEGSKAWWWGDYFIALETRKGEHYTSEWAELAGVTSGTLRNWKSVAGFFESSCRHDSLSWQHHYEAMCGADGDLAIAQNWLQLADENKWSVSQMRKAIRQANREHNDDDDPGPPELPYQALYDADHWATSKLQEIKALPKTEKQRLFNNLHALIELVEYLRDEGGGGFGSF